MVPVTHKIAQIQGEQIDYIPEYGNISLLIFPFILIVMNIIFFRYPIVGPTSKILKKF